MTKSWTVRSGKFAESLALLALLSGVAHAGEAAQSNQVRAIELSSTDAGREVVIKTDREPTFSVFRLADPFRILVDISDAEVQSGLEFTKRDDDIVRYTSTHAFKDEFTKIVRVEIALHGEREYDVKARGNAIHVRLSATSSVRLPSDKGSAQSSKVEAKKTASVEPAQIGKLRKRSRGASLALVARLQGSAIDADQVRVEKIEDPARLVIDIPGLEANPKWQKLGVKKLGVTKARLGSRDEGVRVVLDLKKGARAPDVDVRAKNGRLEIGISPAKVAQAEPAPASKPVKAEAPKKAKAQAKAEPAKPVVAQVEKKAEVRAEPRAEIRAAPAGEPTPDLVKVKDVRFERKDGFLRLSLELSDDQVSFQKDPTSSPQVPVIRLESSQLPESLIRTLDTSAVAGEVVRTISTYNEGSDVVLAARIGPETEHRHWSKGKKLMWDFRAKPKAVATPVSGARVLDYPEESTSGYATRAAADLALKAETARRRYRGRRISLDLKDADMHNVLRLLADVSKLNIVASDDVKGTVTLKLRNVPWDQALDIILQSKQLDKVRMGNIIRVAPIDVLEKEEQLKLQRKEALEKLEKLSVRLIAVSYADANGILPQVSSLLSSRGRAQVDSRTNVIIVEDIPENLLKIERLVRTLDTQTPQVLIEARIVEAATSFTRELGIQWGGNVAMIPAYGNSTGLAFPNSIRIAGGADDGTTPTEGVLADNNFAVNLPAGAGTGTGGAVGFVFGSAGGASILSLRLTAAEQEGRTKLISQPKIVTLDNRKARIVSGERIPITVITANGPTTRFINAFLELNVTPHVTSDGGILMNIQAAKNEVSARTDLLGTPGIVTREAATEMLIQDGDTAVLGGIYRRTATESEAGVPFFKEIPILGWLFQTTARDDAREELLIFISPRIVNRAEALVTSG